MKIDVNKVFSVKNEYEIKDVLAKEEFNIEGGELLEDVTFYINMKKIEKEIYLNGNYRFKLRVQCVNCLEYFEEVISDDFEAVFLPDYIYKDYEETTKSENEYNYREILKEKLEDNCFIDIKKLIQEYIIVAMPEFPKCSSECEGVKEVNQYQNENIDPRWQQLLNIVKEK